MHPDSPVTAQLSPAQRYFYEVNGYVILKNIFSPAACQRLIALADQMDADAACAYKHDGYPKTAVRTVLSRCAWYDPQLLETAMHPTILPIIEGIVGGSVRLEEHQFIINYPDPSTTTQPRPAESIRTEGWHRGIAPNFGSFQANGHFHCLFTKALIYLTDNGPGEGTWVVPGSHRLDLPTKQLVEFIDETLARQLETQAGDVLILSETLIHAAPSLSPNASPRYTLIYGYTAPFMQTWNRYDPPADLLTRITPHQQAFLTGELRYGFRSGQF